MGGVLVFMFLLGVSLVVVVAALLRTNAPDDKHKDDNYMDHHGNRPDFR